jgi:hypothetical protein
VSPHWMTPSTSRSVSRRVATVIDIEPHPATIEMVRLTTAD